MSETLAFHSNNYYFIFNRLNFVTFFIYLSYVQVSGANITVPTGNNEVMIYTLKQSINLFNANDTWVTSTNNSRELKVTAYHIQMPIGSLVDILFNRLKKRVSATYAPPCNETSDCYEKMGFVCHNETCVCRDGLLLKKKECFGGTLCVKENDENCTDTKRANCTLGSCNCDEGELVLRKPDCLAYCDTNEDCHMEVGYGCTDGLCMCLKGLREQNGQCLIGGECESHADCQAISNSTCVLKECACPYGQILSHEVPACIPMEKGSCIPMGNGACVPMGKGDESSGFRFSPLSVANFILNAAAIFTASHRFI